MVVPSFPIIFVEKTWPQGIQVFDSVCQIANAASEYADIIDEFCAWDSQHRPIDLMLLATASRSNVLSSLPKCAHDAADSESVWQMIRSAEQRLGTFIGTRDPVSAARMLGNTPKDSDHTDSAQ